VLLLQINAAVLLLLIVACVAHEITLWCDLAYASKRRVIPPYEQWVHGAQLAAPWVGLVSLLVIHREQVLSMVGVGNAVADWHWRWKQPFLPSPLLWAIAGLGLLLVAGPFVQEYWRCVRVRRASLLASSTDPRVSPR
jgi:hypothetical protein